MKWKNLQEIYWKQSKTDYRVHPISGVNVQPDIIIRRLLKEIAYSPPDCLID
jgi:hypothetical protein